MKIPIQVSIHLFKYYQGDLLTLLLLRVPQGGGFWQGITGALEPGEVLETAARREIFEETGLFVQKLQASGMSFSYPVNERWRHKYSIDTREITEHIFTALLSGDIEIVLSDEHSNFEWVKVSVALERLVAFDSQRAAFISCLNILGATPEPPLSK